MRRKDFLYLYVILFHILIGFVIYLAPFLSKIYGFSMFLYAVYYIISNKNSNNQALIAAAYITGSEVFLRMTNGNITYEFSKYGVMVLLLIGAYYKGFSRGSTPYWIYLLLLVPSIIISAVALDYDVNVKSSIAFNISGAICLGVASLYTYRRKIALNQMNFILLSLSLPIVSCMSYLTFYTPNIRDVITSTQSNFETSGGFGPNQVATFLGLGMFVFFSRIILESKNKYLVIINLIIALNLAYRGIITFSRGGVVTGFVMILILLLFLYLKTNFTGKVKLNYIIIILVTGLMVTWTYSSFQTNGLINNRYANQDAQGRVKNTKLSGREGIANTEIKMFLENPIFGVGVAKGAEIREIETGKFAVSHDEITRMLAEHGTLGIFALLILVLTPLVLYINNQFNMYLICFLLFWFLTINHAAMRTALPAFVYSLSLLNVQIFPPKKENEF